MKKIISKIRDYFIGVWKELSKVTWPSRSTVINHTIIVLISAAVVMIIVSALDFGLSKSVEYLLSLKK